MSFWTSSILPKNKLENSTFCPTRAEIFRSFFGRIENTKMSFQNQPTFTRNLQIVSCTGRKYCKIKGGWKRGSLLGNEEMDLGGDLPFFELEYWNFQHMLDLWFREASQNLSSFRQLFFHSFQGGTKGKMLKNQCIVLAIFQHFSFGPPLETMKKKVV